MFYFCIYISPQNANIYIYNSALVICKGKITASNIKLFIYICQIFYGNIGDSSTIVSKGLQL